MIQRGYGSTMHHIFMKFDLNFHCFSGDIISGHSLMVMKKSCVIYFKNIRKKIFQKASVGRELSEQSHLKPSQG